MPRTQAQIEAAERDGLYCLWHKYRSENPALAPLSDEHHIARRQPGSDRPELIIGLCRVCHTFHHNGRSPTTAELLDLMLDLYHLDLRRDFPLFFAGY